MFKLVMEYLMKSFDVIKKEIIIFAIHFEYSVMKKRYIQMIIDLLSSKTCLMIMHFYVLHVLQQGDY